MEPITCGPRQRILFGPFFREKLRVGRGDGAVAPSVQTSTCNHVIERLWVELDHCVTYPVKRIVTAMRRGLLLLFDMNCP